MDGLVINISWEYFLGVMGALIGVAYYTNGRFTAVETDVGWLKETIAELAIAAENVSMKLFKNGSPVSLTAAGYHALRRSGLKSYIDTKRAKFLKDLNARTSSGQYELQRRAFRLFAELPFENPVKQHLDNYAFKNGLSTTILRRVGAIYLRDIAVESI